MSPTGVPAATEPRPRSPMLLGMAALVVVAAVAVILLLGVQRPPALPSLAESPDPPPSGAVAWTVWEAGENCLYVARPSGEVVRPWCDRRGGDVAGWDGEQILVRHWDSGERLMRIDPATGEAVSTQPEQQPDDADAAPERERDLRAGTGPREEAVWTDRDDGTLVLRASGTDAVLWRTEAPETYTVDGGSRSPDGDWIAVTDAADRLLLIAADGGSPPRIWADDVPAWRQLHWQGAAAG